MDNSKLERLAAFTEQPGGGNPAGVWTGSSLPEDAEMQRIAKAVGYSETAFLTPTGADTWTIRYFSPEAEVPFCGHATIASGVALGNRHGEGLYRLQTSVGEVPVQVRRNDEGQTVATLTSVEPQSKPIDPALLTEVLGLLGWLESDLDPNIPAAIAFAGAWHLVIAVAERAVLARLDYDFPRLKALMLEHDLTTLQLVWQQDRTTFHSRNPFPVGGVVEDPATGAAAAAFGGYLRELGRVTPPADVRIRQGEDMGRPSTLFVHIPTSGGIAVTGAAIAMASD
ncbi:MAG: PhzF family phenazine biosynthesis isomerase, partial [Acidobacteriota bacterium]